MSGKADLSISPDTRARVLAAAQELGYAPNSAAQALRSGKTGLIGFWMCLSYSRYRSMVLDGMRRILAPTDLALAVADVDEDYAWHHSFTRALRIPVEGVIAFDMSTAGEAFAQDSARLAPNLPYVSMGAYWSAARSHVGVDLRTGAEMAVEHLLETGRRRIAYVTTHDSDEVVEAGRFAGYVTAINTAGLEPRRLEVSPLSTERIASIQRTLAECLHEGTLPDALLCMFDDIAVDAVEALLRLGLRPGKEIALVGFNGTEGTERGPCPITVVRQPIETMCALAFEFLQAQIADPRAPVGKRVLTPELVVRASSSA